MQELRILAQLSKEEKFIDAINNNIDLHSYSASLIYGIPYEDFMMYDENGKQLFNAQGEPEIKPSMKKGVRDNCKKLSFGLLYGAGPKKLASQLNITFEEAKELVKKYFDTFPKIKILMDKFVKEAKRDKYALSPLDGRRVALDIDWTNPALVAHAMNQAKNLPFQGNGATITKLAMCYIDQEIKQQNIPAYIVDTIHDELLIEVQHDYTKQMKQIVENKMIEAFNFYCPDVKMSVVAEVGSHWIH